MPRAADDLQGHYLSLHTLGIAYQQGGQPAQSLDPCRQALTLARTTGDPISESLILSTLANSQMAMGMTEEAIHHHTQAVELAEKHNSPANLTSLLNLGAAHILQARYTEGINYSTRAAALAHDKCEPEHEGMALGNIGEAYGALGRHDLAIDYTRQAIDILLQSGSEWRAVESLQVLAHSLEHQGRPDSAEQARQQARNITERYKGTPAARRA